MDDNAAPALLATALEELYATARKQIEAAEAKAKSLAAAAAATAVAPPAASASAMAEKVGVELCNEVFRLRRNAEQMVKEGKESKELRGIQRVQQNIEMLLDKQGIQYFDLTGRKWDDRDNDFEPVGQPEEVPGLDGKRIGRCERPLVKVNGKIVQRAKGTVQRPT